jgi:hypothetical protein
MCQARKVCLNCLVSCYDKCLHPNPYGVPPCFIILRERQCPQKNPAYINILNNLEKNKNIVINVVIAF